MTSQHFGRGERSSPINLFQRASDDPADPAVEQSNQGRRPLMIADPENANARKIAAIAAQLLGESTSADDTAAEHAAA